MRQNKHITNTIQQLPSSPGVYLFKDAEGTIIYIGKSANIRARVRSYFRTHTQTSRATHVALVKDIADIEAVETESEVAALVKESELIKKHKPKFNVLMRDSKNYVYVGITREDFPRVFITHQPTKKHSPSAQYIGPYTEARPLKKTLRLLRKIFPHYTKRTAPSALERQLGLVPQKDISKTAYRDHIQAIRNILRGKSKAVLRTLKNNIARAAKKQQYERAQHLREQYEHLQSVMQHAHVLGTHTPAPPIFSDTAPNLAPLGAQKDARRIEAYDISNIQGEEAVGSMVVFTRDERNAWHPEKSSYRLFNIKKLKTPNDPGMIRETLARRMQHTEWPVPDLIVIDGGKGQLSAARKTLDSSLPVIALAKQNEDVYLPGKRDPVPADRFGQETKRLLQALRDEAHRFALKQHRKRHKRGVIKSTKKE